MSKKFVIINKELTRGVEIEKEHAPTYAFLASYVAKHGQMPPPETMFTRIAMDHLREDPHYYSRHPDI